MTTMTTPSGLHAEALRSFWPGGTGPQNYVDGAWTTAAVYAETFDPSTGNTFAVVPETTKDEVDAAVRAAARAQPAWAGLTMSQRAEHLSALKAVLDAKGEELALLEAIDSGNPLPSTRRDVGLALRYLTEWPGLALSATGRFTRAHADGISLISAEPYGVVGKIIAYNHPMLFAIAGMIYPLMAGNTMVIKTSTQTPVATLALGEVIDGVLPPGVVNIVSGGADAGDALVTHPQVKRLAFTGSEATALAIQKRLSVSGMVKHFSAELGGKNPFIVFADADVSAAVDAAFAGLSFHISAGQSCQSTARILVHESIISEVEAGLATAMRRLTLGPAYEDATEMGPVVSREHARRIEEFIRGGIDEGARLVVGGGTLKGGGYFIEPTLFSDVTPSMTIAREEIFGPVATLMPFATEDEAIRLANDTRYGLSAAVWTNDLDRALRVSAQVQAGYVWVNDANRHYPGSPFGGMKASGIGREETVDELFGYTESKSVNIRVRSA